MVVSLSLCCLRLEYANWAAEMYPKTPSEVGLWSQTASAGDKVSILILLAGHSLLVLCEMSRAMPQCCILQSLEKAPGYWMLQCHCELSRNAVCWSAQRTSWLKSGRLRGGSKGTLHHWSDANLFSACLWLRVMDCPVMSYPRCTRALRRPEFNSSPGHLKYGPQEWEQPICGPIPHFKGFLWGWYGTSIGMEVPLLGVPGISLDIDYRL